jgi:hypothetical protein
MPDVLGRAVKICRPKERLVDANHRNRERRQGPHSDIRVQQPVPNNRDLLDCWRGRGSNQRQARLWNAGWIRAASASAVVGVADHGSDPRRFQQSRVLDIRLHRRIGERRRADRSVDTHPTRGYKRVSCFILRHLYPIRVCRGARGSATEAFRIEPRGADGSGRGELASAKDGEMPPVEPDEGLDAVGHRGACLPQPGDLSRLCCRHGRRQSWERSRSSPEHRPNPDFARMLRPHASPRQF